MQSFSLNIAKHDASRERYRYNLDKTKFIAISYKEENIPTLILNNMPLEESQKEKHVGFIRTKDGSNMDTINKRIKDSQGQIFSLMPSGLYGYNGAGPEVTLSMYRTYVTEMLFHGLGVILMSPKELDTISLYHRKNLRYIQHFPPSTATPGSATGSDPGGSGQPGQGGQVR